MLHDWMSKCSINIVVSKYSYDINNPRSEVVSLTLAGDRSNGIIDSQSGAPLELSVAFPQATPASIFPPACKMIIYSSMYFL